MYAETRMRYFFSTPHCWLPAVTEAEGDAFLLAISYFLHICIFHFTFLFFRFSVIFTSLKKYYKCVVWTALYVIRRWDGLEKRYVDIYNILINWNGKLISLHRWHSQNVGVIKTNFRYQSNGSWAILYLKDFSSFFLALQSSLFGPCVVRVVLVLYWQWEWGSAAFIISIYCRNSFFASMLLFKHYVRQADDDATRPMKTQRGQWRWPKLERTRKHYPHSRWLVSKGHST